MTGESDRPTITTTGGSTPTRIPITVLGGYLGAGKTTLLNGLLRLKSLERWAVIVNDFGDISIDAHLISAAEDDVIALANGCVCCSLGDGLWSTLRSLRDRVPQPQAIIIEASGVSDPRAIAHWGKTPGFSPGPVIVCADLSNVDRLLTDRYVGDTVRRQLDVADVIVATKADLVSDAAASVASLRALVDVPVLVGDQTDVVASLLFAPAFRQTDDALDLDRLPHHHHISRSWNGRTSRLQLTTFLDAPPAGIVRVKGIIELSDEPDAVVRVDMVGRHWTVVPFHDGDSPTSQAGRPGIVVIGTAEADPADLDRWLAALDGPPKR